MVTLPLRFDGPEATRADRDRLTEQHIRIRTLMADGQWRSLRQIARVTGDPEASVSAQLRFLRRPRFGSYIVERQPSGDRARGLFVYRVLAPAVGQEPLRSLPDRGLKARVAELERVVAKLQTALEAR